LVRSLFLPVWSDAISPDYNTPKPQSSHALFGESAVANTKLTVNLCRCRIIVIKKSNSENCSIPANSTKKANKQWTKERRKTYLASAQKRSETLAQMM